MNTKLKKGSMIEMNRNTIDSPELTFSTKLSNFMFPIPINELIQKGKYPSIHSLSMKLKNIALEIASYNCLILQNQLYYIPYLLCFVENSLNITKNPITIINNSNINMNCAIFAMKSSIEYPTNYSPLSASL